jgi:uncharacterized protein
VRFRDTSALLLLLVEDPRSGWARSLLQADRDIVAWWGTPVECASAVARLRREGRIDSRAESGLLRLADRLRSAWIEIQPAEEVRARAMRVLRLHSLRSLDAFQLAAALTWAGPHAGGDFVTLDQRLADAARAEGFEVLLPDD